MQELEVVTSADRRDLGEQLTAVFRPLWPEFIFHDPIAGEYISRVETFFAQYDVLLLDGGEVVTGGWGVPIRWDGTVGDLPDGYDEALVRSVTGHEDAVSRPTRCASWRLPSGPAAGGAGWPGKHWQRSASERPQRGCNG